MRGYQVGVLAGIAAVGLAANGTQAATLTAIAEVPVGAMELAEGHARLHQTEKKNLGPDVGFNNATTVDHHWNNGVAYAWEYQFTGSVIVFKLGAATVTTPASLSEAATGFAGSLRNLRPASDEAYEHQQSSDDEDDDQHDDKGKDKDKNKSKDKDKDKDKGKNKNKHGDNDNDDDDDSKSIFTIPSDLALFFSIDEINGEATGLDGFTLLLGDSVDFAYNAGLGDTFSLKGTAAASWSGNLKHSPNQNFSLSLGAFAYDDPALQPVNAIPADNNNDDEGRNARAAPTPSALALLLAGSPMMLAAARRRRGRL